MMTTATMTTTTTMTTVMTMMTEWPIKRRKMVEKFARETPFVV